MHCWWATCSRKQLGRISENEPSCDWAERFKAAAGHPFCISGEINFVENEAVINEKRDYASFSCESIVLIYAPAQTSHKKLIYGM